MVLGKIVPNSSYVLQGDQYKADLFVAAYSTTENPEIIVGTGWDSVNNMVTGDTTVVPVVDGVGKYVVNATGTGMRKFSAMIKLKKPGAEGKNPSDYKYYPIKDIEYRVAPPSVVVSPTKMNVLYRGIDNPISVSAAGMSAEDISASGTNVTLRGTKPGEYIARPGKGNISRISVTAKVDGKSKSMGAPQEFRVKDVPDPIAKIGGKKGGTMRKKQLIAAKRVDAVLENFAFDLSFSVVGFTVEAKMPDGFYVEKPGKGSSFNQNQIKVIKQVKVGQRVTFNSIKAKGPDGRTRDLGSIQFKLIP